VVLDRLETFSHLFPIPLKYSAYQVEDIFFREVFRLHGLPRYIVSERDNIFVSAFWKEFFRLSGIELTPIRNYHPWMNGKKK
jgi:hypothetical protein